MNVYINNSDSSASIIKGFFVGYQLVAYIVGTDTIESNNILNMDLNDPPSDVLVSILNHPEIDSSMIITNKDAKYNQLQIHAFNVKSGIRQGTIVKSSIPPGSIFNPGVFLTYFLYVDRNVNVLGISKGYSSESDTIVTNVDLKLKEGYNKVNIKFKILRSNYREFDYFDVD
ncbi:MAG: hypothetical protein LH629_08495 [Ignavibacteria bacterium]|nr:hypothetical protein [Ignavibacteria bacterium]